MIKKNSQKASIAIDFACMVAYITLLKEVICEQSPNLLVNGDFNMSDLNGSVYAFFNPIPGWYCTSKCQVNDCYKLNQLKMTVGLYGANCTGYIVDLISNTPQNLTQNVILEQEYYNLSLNYYYPIINANLKTFQVYFNEEKVFSHTPTVGHLYLPFYFEKIVKGVVGVNTLRITTKRNSGTDNNGFFVNNIRLAKMANSHSSLVNNTLLSDAAVIISMIPGSRVVFMDLMAFFANFDRLQFYYFHNRNYSQYSTALLAGINILNDIKGLFFQSVLQKLSQNISNQIDSFFSSIDYKYQYTPSIALKRDESGWGFISNCYPFFVYSVPGTIVTYILLMGLFKMVRNRPASRLIRKFSFLGILMLMVFEGNIESLTYYSIGEMTLFFSANFHHRFINIFIVFFQLIVTIFAVGSVLFFKYNYRRLIFYFIEDKRNNYMGILCQIVDNGVICLLFGIAHQILFSKPNLQLFVLLSLECLWMTFRMYLISRKAYRRSFSQFIMFIAGLARICLIITFYFYEEAGQMRSLINDAFQYGLIIVTLLLWMQALLISLFQLLISIPEFFAKLRLLNKKTNMKIFNKQEFSQTEDVLKKIQRKIQSNLRKSKNKTTNTSLYKVFLRSSNVKYTNVRSDFKTQKVRITQLRIKGLLKEGQRNELSK